MRHSFNIRVFAPAAGTAALGALGVVLAACSDAFTAGRNLRDASLSLAARPSTAVAAGREPAAIMVTGTDGRTVDVQTVDIIFSEITFERRDGEANDDDDSDADSDSDHAGNARFRTGAATVALPLDGGVITPFTGQLPLGTYDRLEMDAEFARIRGTFDGQSFDVTVPIDRELELRFSPPLVVDANTEPINVSVQIDVASWFRTSTGAIIDPRLLATDATLRQQFRQRVAASFKAFEDQDGDADDDDSDSDSDSDSEDR